MEFGFVGADIFFSLYIYDDFDNTGRTVPFKILVPLNKTDLSPFVLSPCFLPPHHFLRFDF